jgi:hypothetical protein
MNFVPGCWYVMFLGCWLQLLYCSFSLHGSIINTIKELLRVETWHNSLISFLSCGALWWQICSYLDTEMLLFGKLVYGIAEGALTRHYASRVKNLLWFKLCFWLFFIPSAVFITLCYWFSTPSYDSTCNNVDFNHSFPVKPLQRNRDKAPQPIFCMIQERSTDSLIDEVLRSRPLTWT